MAALASLSTDVLNLHLMVACESGNWQQALRLLRAGAQPDWRDEETGECPVYAAAREGHDMIVSLLARQGANVDQVEAEGFSPLYLAAQNDHIRAAECLLAAQALVDLAQPNGTTPLLIAAQLGHSGMVRRLLRAGADVNRGNGSGTTPLYIAAQYGNVRLIDLLLEGGAAPDQAETDGTSPLWITAQNDHLEAASRIILAGAITDCRRLETRSTPLFIAAETGNLSVVNLLLQSGADAELADHRDETPIYTASWYGHNDVVDSLVRAGAVVDAPRFDGTTPLYRAAVRRHPGVVQRLLLAGADVNRRASNGDTALIGASRIGDAAMVEQLLQAGADASLTAMDPASGVMFSPLRAAVEFKHTQVVGAILAAAACRASGWSTCEEFRSDALGCTRLARDRGMDSIVHLFEAFWDAGGSGSKLTPGLTPVYEGPAFAAGSSQTTVSSRELHESLNAAGFTQERAAFQCALADVLEGVIRGHRNTDNVHLVGSYSEGWGNSLVSLNGRTDPDSDLDLTEYAHRRQFHIQGRCRCPDPNPEDVLDYDSGHVTYNGASSNPSLPDKGSDLRPAMDLVPAFACCCYPEIGALLPENALHMPAALVADLRRELSRHQSCHLIRASAPGMEARQLRVSTTFLEKAFMRSLTTLQGQLFLALKFLIKRAISKDIGVQGLKSYHAKTLTFRAVAHTQPERWRPDNLVELIGEALEDLQLCLASSPPDECMRHFFMRDAPLYLRRRSSDKADIVAAVAEVRNALGPRLAQFAAQLRPLPHLESSFRLHPFTLLPMYLLLPWPEDSQQLQYHHVYPMMHQLVLDLGTETGQPRTVDELQRLRELAGSLPDWAHTARTCLQSLALLRMSQPDEAASQLRHGLAPDQRARRPLLRSVPVGLGRGQADGGRGHLRRLLMSTDSAWRFCLCYGQLPWPSLDHLLPERCPHVRFPCHLASYENFFYLNFEALARLMCSQLAPELLADEAGWFEELRTGDADWLEFSVFAWHSRDPVRLAEALTRLRTLRGDRVEMLRDIEEKIARVAGR